MFKDHFSEHAAAYAAHRPTYPAKLFEVLAGMAPRRSRAWDAGTGNGQAAVDLAGRFEMVVATDPSVQQLANATKARGVRYVRARSEQPAMRSRSVDCITVAQALHWFDRDAFFIEVERVAREGALLAVWSYGTFFRDDTDATLERFHEVVASYWPPERPMVEDGYAALRFPFEELEAPSLEMSVTWTADQTLDYLRTWSAVQRFRRANGNDPVESIAADLRDRWGGGSRRVRWPLHLRLFRIR